MAGEQVLPHSSSALRAGPLAWFHGSRTELAEPGELVAGCGPPLSWGLGRVDRPHLADSLRRGRPSQAGARTENGGVLYVVCEVAGFAAPGTRARGPPSDPSDASDAR
jgi:hypothetical protein